MNNSSPALKTEDLSIGFGGRSAGALMQNISVTAGKGELVALFGPNGVGKSTLLRTLAKLQPAVAGHISLVGKDLRNYSRTQLSRQLGFVSTEPLRINNLRVLDLVSLGRYPYTGWMGRLGRKDSEIVDEAIEMVMIGPLRHKFFHQLSDGERQRAMVARTLAQDTGIIILDEPTAFLDLPNRHELVHLLHNLAVKKEKAIIFSTHDLGIAIREASKIWLMLSGGIIQGAPEDLIIDGSFGQMFAGTNISFDRSLGDFRTGRSAGRPVSLSGPAMESRWTRNALERIGFNISGDSAADIEVKILEGKDVITWEVTCGTETKEFCRIYDMCLYLSSLEKSATPD